MTTARSRRIPPYLLALLLAVAARAAGAQGAPPGLEQLVHRAWTIREGAPGSARVSDPACDQHPTYAAAPPRRAPPPYACRSAAGALAQTDDGVLWIGTTAGLYHFDGVRFARFEPPDGQTLRAQSFSALRALPGGGLWIGYYLGGASLYSGGRLTEYGEREGLGPRAVLDFARDSSGTAWIATAGDLTRLVAGRWRAVGVADGFRGDGATSLLVDRRGTLWAAAPSGDTGVYVLPRRARRFERRPVPRQAGERAPAVRHLSEAPDGSVWGVASDHGFVMLADAAGAAPAPDAPRYRARGWWQATFDARGRAWLSGRLGQLVRITMVPTRRPPAPSRAVRGPAIVAETLALARSGPLTGDVVSRVLEDREGSVWLSTEGGLDQLREARLTPVRWTRSGFSPALAAGDSGGMWLASYGDSPSLALGDRLIAHPEVPSPVTCAHRDQHGGVWFGGPRGLWHRAGSGRFAPVALPTDLTAPPTVLAIARGGDGTLWLTTARDGVFRRRRGAWERFGPRKPRARAVVADGAGRVWLGYEDGHVLRVTDSGSRRFGAADGLRLGTVVGLHVRGDRVWASGEVGVASLEAAREGARFVPLALAAGAPRGVSGVVEHPNGELWLNSADGVIRVADAELRRARSDATYRASSERFDHRDGVDGRPSQGYPLPSAVAGTDGRLWFATGGGAAWVDPRDVRRNTVPPPVEIRAVDAGGRSYAASRRVTLPRGTTALSVAYTAYSLAVPERVRFRYRLVGLAAAWQDAGPRREAYYTNLGPGAYRFEVQAANDDGLWSATGAALDLVIPATFTQSNTFLTLCAAIGCGTLWSFGAWGQRRVSAAARARSDAVLAERLRVARELHDTLLSDIAGVTMQLDAVTTTPAGGDVGAIISVVAGIRDQARRALDDARRAVVGLRTGSDDSVPLEARLADTADRVFAGTDIAVRVDVGSAPRRLPQEVGEVVYRVVAEAMVNARTHAGCGSVEVRCSFERHTLTVRVLDDGRGFDPAGAPATGHYGLVGMRERAAAIGARLTVESAAGRGTEVRLVVPARYE